MLQPVYKLAYRFNLAGEELYVSLLKGLIQICHFIIIHHLVASSMKEKCLILIPKEAKVASKSVYLSMNCLGLTVELHFLSINLLQSKPHFIIYQINYHRHLAQLIN